MNTAGIPDTSRRAVDNVAVSIAVAAVLALPALAFLHDELTAPPEPPAERQPLPGKDLRDAAYFE